MASLWEPLPSLRSTRFVVLHGGSRGASLIANLKTAVLEEQPDYECLSYTWGDATADHTITIDNVSEKFNL